MSWMNSIISYLKENEQSLYTAYLTVYGWVYPFNQLAGPLLFVSRAFGWLAYYFSLFNAWLVDVNNKVINILSWDTIKSYILTWLPTLEMIVDWFPNKVAWFTSAITSWWSSTSTTVQGWISVAVQPFNSMLAAWNGFWNTTWPQFANNFNSLKTAWDNFWSVTLPTLVSFKWLTTWWNDRLLDIQGLINSAFLARDSLWSGWQDMRGKVVEFFADPVEFIWNRFADWFLGPEK